MGKSDSRSRSELLQALRTDERTAAEAAASLGRRRDAKALAGLIQAARSRRLPQAVDALVAVGDPAIPSLVRALAGPKPEFAQQALARMGERSTDYLMQALHSSNRQVFAIAAATLGASQDPAAPEVLLAELARGREFNPNLLNAFVRSIIQHRPLKPYVLDEMLRLVDGPATDGHSNVVAAVGFTLDSRFITPLSNVLADEARLRSWASAARSLGFIVGPDASPTTIDVLVSRALDSRQGFGYSSARLEAIRALGRMRHSQSESVLTRLAHLAVERPLLAPSSASKEQRDRNLNEQALWNIKVIATAALAHLADPTASLDPPREKLGPIMPTQLDRR